MILENINYVPTLAIRPSEMNGLSFLPAATKDRMFPCFLLAPWANSSSLSKSIERIERAFPKRKYFLDIDRDYELTNLESAPQQEMLDLINPENNYKNWIEFISQHENIYPCIQVYNVSENEIRNQIYAFQKIERPYCLRITPFQPNKEISIAAIAATGSADFAIILEGGWTNDALTLSSWFEGLVSNALKKVDADIPTILSCTSMPKLFTSFDGIRRVPFANRQLVSQISRNTNRNRIIYGDWGSTRPREPSGYANRPLDRIDYPTEDAWFIIRSKELNWTFNEAANQLIYKSKAWSGKLQIWGEEMILNTSIDESIGINTPPKNVASRVNIHLHRQSFYDQEIETLDLDEDWED